MSIDARQYRARSFGLLWQSDIELEHFESAIVGDGSADVVVYETPRLRDRDPIERINQGFVYTGHPSERIRILTGIDQTDLFTLPFQIPV